MCARVCVCARARARVRVYAQLERPPCGRFRPWPISTRTGSRIRALNRGRFGPGSGLHSDPLSRFSSALSGSWIRSCAHTCPPSSRPPLPPGNPSSLSLPPSLPSPPLPPLYLSIYLSIYLSLNLSLYLSIYLSLSPSHTYTFALPPSL